MEGREIALVVAVRRATDGSGWLALTPPHRETFKWQSACRAMVPCHNYRPKARERELSNAASMLNLGKHEQIEESLPPPKPKWFNAPDTKATKIPLVAYLFASKTMQMAIDPFKFKVQNTR